MEFITLNNGIKMPMVGFGVYQLTDSDQCEQLVLDALTAGYRLIDTAASYGNEEAVGQAIKKSGVPRDELFVTSKLWIQDASEQGAKQAYQNSLEKLGLDYLDLYLIHQPYGDIYGAWRGLTEIYKADRVRAIGVSNLYPDRLVDLILHNEITPAVNQIEVHPFFQNAEYLELMKNKSVQVEAWGPLAEGKNDIFENEVLKSIGTKYRKSVAQVILRWQLQCGVVTIPKSTHKERIYENINIFDFSLEKDDMKQITALDTNKSVVGDFTKPFIVEMLCSRKM